MLLWIRRKAKLELMQVRYHKLMKRAFKTALYDKVKSDQLNAEASELLKEINLITEHR